MVFLTCCYQLVSSIGSYVIMLVFIFCVCICKTHNFIILQLEWHVYACITMCFQVLQTKLYIYIYWHEIWSDEIWSNHIAHDYGIKWKPFPRYWPFVWGIHQSPVNSPHKGQWRRALMFSLICAWTNGWVNNRDVDDLRCHSTHFDVTVM